MIPRHHDGADTCLQSCLGSMMEVDPNLLPDFGDGKEPWQVEVERWLKPFGKRGRWFYVEAISRSKVPSGYWMAIVRSYPGEDQHPWTHARVMRGRRIAFDPGSMALERRRRYISGLEIVDL